MSAAPRDLLRGVRVAPSILSADFGRLREQVREVLQAGARVIHVDVMDGHFVPPITVGPLVVQALSEAVRDAGGMLEVHLMIERPERQVMSSSGRAPTRSPSTPRPRRTSPTPRTSIRESGACVGVAINPGTPVGALAEVAGAVDVALCMTVNPGWGGQPFIAHSLEKLPRVRALVGEDVAVEVDGGIDSETACRCRAGRREPVRRRLGRVRSARSRRCLPRDRGCRGRPLTCRRPAEG